MIRGLDNRLRRIEEVVRARQEAKLRLDREFVARFKTFCRRDYSPRQKEMTRTFDAWFSAEFPMLDDKEFRDAHRDYYRSERFLRRPTERLALVELEAWWATHPEYDRSEPGNERVDGELARQFEERIYDEAVRNIVPEDKRTYRGIPIGKGPTLRIKPERIRPR